MIAGVAFGGVWGIPRDYVIENLSSEDQTLVTEILGAVAHEQGLSDRSFWADDLVTFAYYTSDAGTIRARLVEKRGVVFVVFLASARKTAEAIDVRLCEAFAARFGERFTRVPALRKKPNQVPEPTSGSVTPRADARVAPPPPVAHR